MTGPGETDLANHDKQLAQENYDKATEFLLRAQQSTVEAGYLRGLGEDAEGRDVAAMSHYLSAVVHAVLAVTDQLRSSRKASWP